MTICEIDDVHIGLDFRDLLEERAHEAARSRG
jgi:hypothetical protein